MEWLDNQSSQHEGHQAVFGSLTKEKILDIICPTYYHPIGWISW